MLVKEEKRFGSLTNERQRKAKYNRHWTLASLSFSRSSRASVSSSRKKIRLKRGVVKYNCSQKHAKHRAGKNHGCWDITSQVPQPLLPTGSLVPGRWDWLWLWCGNTCWTMLNHLLPRFTPGRALLIHLSTEREPTISPGKCLGPLLFQGLSSNLWSCPIHMVFSFPTDPPTFCGLQQEPLVLWSLSNQKCSINGHWNRRT